MLKVGLTPTTLSLGLIYGWGGGGLAMQVLCLWIWNGTPIFNALHSLLVYTWFTNFEKSCWIVVNENPVEITNEIFKQFTSYYSKVLVLPFDQSIWWIVELPDGRVWKSGYRRPQICHMPEMPTPSYVLSPVIRSFPLRNMVATFLAPVLLRIVGQFFYIDAR